MARMSDRKRSPPALAAKAGAASIGNGSGPATRAGRGDNGKTAVQVLERMVSLLDGLAQQPDPVSLKDLSLRTGLHPSTAHRILNDLVWARFVDRVEPGTYQLGMRLLELGNLVKARLNVRDAALAVDPAPAFEPGTIRRAQARELVLGRSLQARPRNGDRLARLEDRRGDGIRRPLGAGEPAIEAVRRGERCHRHDRQPDPGAQGRLESRLDQAGDEQSQRHPDRDRRESDPFGCG